MPTSVRPTTSNEVRKWTFLQNSENFWRIYDWPDELVRLALKPHLANRERFFLLLFLLHNGAHPDWAEHVVLGDGTGYDDAAKRHVAYLKANWQRYAIKYWDLGLQEYVNYDGSLQGRSFDYSRRGGYDLLGRADTADVPQHHVRLPQATTTEQYRPRRNPTDVPVQRLHRERNTYFPGDLLAVRQAAERVAAQVRAIPGWNDLFVQKEW